jgi:hypothetical protein
MAVQKTLRKRDLSTRSRAAALAVLIGVFSLATAPRSQAMSPDVKSVMIGGVYGIAVGTGLGLLALPGTRSVRGIFMGSSIGLYLGMVAGYYHSRNRDNPQNPLRVGLLMDSETSMRPAGLAVSWELPAR